MDQIASNEELLNTASDCFKFVTKFFEPINLSAVHIYHSALELSPLSSIVRRLYYYQQHTTSPRVVAGTPDSWGETVSISNTYKWGSTTWSPCGQFVVAVVQDAVEIRDALSSELVSTFTKPATYCDCGLAYSPDGQSLACLSDILVIWDIQTGGAAKEIQYNICDCSIVWSLDGKKVGMTKGTTVHVYDVASGTTCSPGTLRSNDRLHIWAHNRSFRIMATEVKHQVLTIIIFEVGLGLTKVESFQIGSWEQDRCVGSFSPTTYQISVSTCNWLHILDIQNSEYLLEEGGGIFDSHCFSSDGSLFAASLNDVAHIWQCISGCYTHWRKFSIQNQIFCCNSPLLFSPTSPSILGRFNDVLQVYHFGSPPIADHCNISTPHVILSPCGTYMATAHKGESTITITNLLSQITPQFIDTDVGIHTFAMTGNVLSVRSPEGLIAWQLTNKGFVGGVLKDQKVGHCNSIWRLPLPLSLEFTLKDQTVAIRNRLDGNIVHTYHSVTGEVLEPVPPHLLFGNHFYSHDEMSIGKHYLHYHGLDEWVPSEGDWLVSMGNLQEGWVKDSEEKHRMWIPVEWRAHKPNMGGWLSNITALWLNPSTGTVIIILQPGSLHQIRPRMS